MTYRLAIFALLWSLVAIFGCSAHGGYHDTPMGDPSVYDAHFPDIDVNGDGQVDKKEFKTRFPQSDDRVYQGIDMNSDGAIDHDEWHEFKQAHGMKHHS